MTIYPSGGRTRPKPRKPSLASLPKPKREFGWVSAVSLALTIFTALLFASGKAYRAAYLATMGFDDMLIPWTFQELVYLGTIKQAPILLVAPAYGLTGIAILLAAIGAVLIWRHKRNRPKRTDARQQGAPHFDQHLELAQFISYCLGGVLIFQLLAVFFVARAENLGKYDAQLELSEGFSANRTASISTVQRYVRIERMVDKERIVTEGYVVSCSEQACALVTPGETSPTRQIIPLNHLVSLRFLR